MLQSFRDFAKIVVFHELNKSEYSFEKLSVNRLLFKLITEKQCAKDLQVRRNENKMMILLERDSLLFGS